jgi:hypothetical protein
MLQNCGAIRAIRVELRILSPGLQLGISRA